MRGLSAVRSFAAWVAALGAVVSIHVAAPPLARAQAADEHQQMDMAPSELFIRAFGAVEWDSGQLPDHSNSFAVGQLSLFVAAPLSERISVVAEMVMEGSTNTRVVTDLERLLVVFRFDDRLQLSTGRYHTGLGFYNATFHHGAYFDTAIGRPRVYLFEDEGGVLPVHDVGVSARGAVPGTHSAMHYVAEIGNGRTWNNSETEADAGRDESSAKATNVGLVVHPKWWEGLEIGGSFYRDLIAQAPSPSIAHRIGIVYVIYRRPSTELMAEWVHLTHRPESGQTFGNNAGYIQASRAWGIFRPYYRYDRLSINPATPLIGQTGSYNGHLFGLRVDPVERLGLKVQYERTRQGALHDLDAVRAQLVFFF